MLFRNNNQAQNTRRMQEEERRRQWMKTEIEDVFGDMMDEMGE